MIHSDSATARSTLSGNPVRLGLWSDSSAGLVPEGQFIIFFFYPIQSLMFEKVILIFRFQALMFDIPIHIIRQPCPKLPRTILNLFLSFGLMTSHCGFFLVRISQLLSLAMLWSSSSSSSRFVTDHFYLFQPPPPTQDLRTRLKYVRLNILNFFVLGSKHFEKMVLIWRLKDRKHSLSPVKVTATRPNDETHHTPLSHLLNWSSYFTPPTEFWGDGY